MSNYISQKLSELHPKLQTNGIGIGNTHRRISLAFLTPIDKSNPLIKKSKLQNKKFLRKRDRRRKRIWEEQRSVRSLGEDFGSSIRESYYGSINSGDGENIDDQFDQNAQLQNRNHLYDIENVRNYDDAINDRDEGNIEVEGANEDDENNELGSQLSRTISLPSRVSETSDAVEPDVDWILREHERRYSITNNDVESAILEEEEERDEDDERRGRRGIRTGAMLDADDDVISNYESFMRRVKKNEANENALNKTLNDELINKNTIEEDGFLLKDDEESEDFANEVVTYKSESKILVAYSIPLIFTFFFEQIFSVVCSVAVGHLGKSELAAVSLASMTTNITLAVFEGIATSLDTLCPQAYGSGNYKGVGIHLQRCVAFSLVIFIPFAFLWYFAEHFLIYLVPKEEKDLIHLTALFLRVVILGAPPYIMFENLKRFLQAQGIFDAGIYVLIICCPLNILLSYLLVWNKTIGLGYIGAPIAVVINFWLMFLLLLAYTVNTDAMKCWPGFSKKALTHWRDLSYLAIPGIVMLEAEDLSYEILTLFCSYFGTSYLAAQSAVSTVAVLMYMGSFAVGVASSTRIAHFIGAKRVDSANIASTVAIIASVFVGFINCFVLTFGRKFIAGIFTRDPDVFKLITEVLPLVGVVEIFDSINCIAGSCLRGQGMQFIGSIVNLIVYYLFAIPLGMFLGWVIDLKIFGLWIGIGSGMLLIGLIESYYVLCPNWNSILERAEMLKETEDDDDDNDDIEMEESDSDSEDEDEDEDENDNLINEHSRLIQV
ncbi:uncharacterized protein SCODWIG_01381 [Saccharomycodes ludwigii]|uniref:Ethionine resistance-conferring protein 1 n=1 Tax=Saccharomycodes ludwigii TaxID=36035 RepID=A0A376B694_9ASCO|nr:hypothetical protein SCDLUD_004884 [Saccharomycodes ludwigii]KAH3899441.1 hypothetical protein SCDLUD_004884 [Saccharomycodes ludwigii]SSD59620.1 uncharacterized protein SCODWIG_01381 [Saccharomycodes ludwigii]